MLLENKVLNDVSGSSKTIEIFRTFNLAITDNIILQDSEYNECTHASPQKHIPSMQREEPQDKRFQGVYSLYWKHLSSYDVNSFSYDRYAKDNQVINNIFRKPNFQTDYQIFTLKDPITINDCDPSYKYSVNIETYKLPTVADNYTKYETYPIYEKIYSLGDNSSFQVLEMMQLTDKEQSPSSNFCLIARVKQWEVHPQQEGSIMPTSSTSFVDNGMSSANLYKETFLPPQENYFSFSRKKTSSTEVAPLYLPGVGKPIKLMIDFAVMPLDKSKVIGVIDDFPVHIKITIKRTKI